MELKPLKVTIESLPKFALVRIINSDNVDAISPTKFLLDPYANIKNNIIQILTQRIILGMNITEIANNDYNININDIQPIAIQQEEPLQEQVVVQTQYDPMDLINGNT